MKRFNVRVYGLYLCDTKILVCEETIQGKTVVKFPGGGLEYGEGTLACLKREFYEELEAEIEITDHYYTTDYFQPSAFDDSQVISIYYMVRPVNTLILPFQNEVGHFYFTEIDDHLLERITLPIDQLVVKKLLGYV